MRHCVVLAVQTILLEERVIEWIALITKSPVLLRKLVVYEGREECHLEIYRSSYVFTKWRLL